MSSAMNRKRKAKGVSGGVFLGLGILAWVILIVLRMNYEPKPKPKPMQVPIEKIVEELACKHIENQTKSGEADFSEVKVTGIKMKPGNYKVIGIVRSTNSYGGLIRREFNCYVDTNARPYEIVGGILE